MPPFRSIYEEKTKIPIPAPRQYIVSQIAEITFKALGVDAIPGFGFQETLELAK
jgi:hypothetical protein